MDKLRFKLLSDSATPPVRGSAGAAGYDLASAVRRIVPARGRALVHTDLAIAVPLGTYGRIAPRSGLAVKNGIDVGAGVVDADYRGAVSVLLFNCSDEDFLVSKGDRVAQLVLECVRTPETVVVRDLDDTERGSGGFGSTGVCGWAGFEGTAPPGTPCTRVAGVPADWKGSASLCLENSITLEQLQQMGPLA